MDEQAAQSTVFNCFDICVQNIRYVCTIPRTIQIPLPDVNNIFNFKQNIDVGGDIDPAYCKFGITYAKDKLIDFTTNFPGIRVIVRGQIILRTLQKEQNEKPSYVSLSIDIVDTECRDFFDISNNIPVTDLKQALNIVDGSCIVVQLTCKIENKHIIISGNIYEKLWKEENIQIQGSSTSPLSTIYFNRNFFNKNTNMP